MTVEKSKTVEKAKEATPKPVAESKDVAAKAEPTKDAAAKAEPTTESKADAAPKKQGRGEGQKPVTQAYKNNWNDIFGKKKKR
jgi:hypothetical protein